MPIELDTFRRKYPQYDDMSDVQLSESLYRKHPEYYDVMQKTYVEDEKRKSYKEPNAFYRELASPILSALSTFATAGIAKESMKAASPEAASAMYPEQQTIPGKLLRGGAELTAVVAGLPARATIAGLGLASKAAPKLILPAAKIAQGTTLQKAATMTAGSAIGGATIAPEEMSGKKYVEQVGISAAAGPVLGMAIGKASKAFAPFEQKAVEALNKAGGVYRDILNPSKKIIQDVEIKSGKELDDYMRLAAEEKLIITETEGKLDTRGAIAQLADRKAELNAHIDDILSSDSAKKYNLEKIGADAKRKVLQTFKDPTERKAALADIDKQIADAVEENGRVVDALTANRIKQGKWQVAFTGMAPNAKKVSGLFGNSLKTAIEKDFDDEAIREINNRLGQYYNLEKILESSSGQVVQQGKLGKYLWMGLGGAVGSVAPVVGTLGGAWAGGKVSRWLVNPERITKGINIPTTEDFLSRMGRKVSPAVKSYLEGRLWNRKPVVKPIIPDSVDVLAPGTEITNFRPTNIPGQPGEVIDIAGREVFPTLTTEQRLGLPNLPPSGYKSFRQKPIITPASGAGETVITMGEKPLPVEAGELFSKVPMQVVEEGETIVPSTVGKLETLLKRATQEEKRVIRRATEPKSKSASHNPKPESRGQKEVTRNPKGSRVIQRKETRKPEEQTRKH